MEIPSRVVLPDSRHEIYVGPSSPSGNKRAPQEVIDFFSAHKRAKNFNHEGYTWHREKEWYSETYHRTRKDEKGFLLAQLDPYFDTLDSLVDKEVPIAEVLPKFGDVRYGHCRIPDTGYVLNLHELDCHEGMERLKRDKLKIPNLETPQFTRKLAFVICRPARPIPFLLATVGGLAYEGRIKK